MLKKRCTRNISCNARIYIDWYNVLRFIIIILLNTHLYFKNILNV